MSRNDTLGSGDRLDLDAVDAGEQDPLNNEPSQPVPTKSLYAMTRQEITRGIANRFVHSRTYIFLYLGMAALSITTVALSLAEGCPGLAFYILEIIINTAMIAEVSVRFVAFGQQFWRSPYNILDLIITIFCVITVLTIVFAGCGSTSKEEEVLDTLLLVARNILQFGRLAMVMRQSGQSIFSRPKPIDLSAARRAGYGMDFDLPDDEEATLSRARARNAVLFDAEQQQRPAQPARPKPAPAPDDRDQEDLWASFG